MSPKELQRVRVIGLLADGRISNQEAAERLGICGRQIIRLKKKYAEQVLESVENNQYGTIENNQNLGLFGHNGG